MEAHHSIESNFIEQFKSIKEENTKYKDLITNFQEKVHFAQLKVNIHELYILDIFSVYNHRMH